MTCRASGIGSWPGRSAREAVRAVADLLGAADLGLPYLPELPARGPGADLIGRSAGLLVELPVDLQPSGWRVTDAPGRDLRRARAFLREDLDELAEAYDGWTGPLRLQVAGPWTLAAAIALPRGERVVHDHGAARDLGESLAEGIRTHLADVARLVPGASLTLQLDEPTLPAVLAGALPTASGFGRLRAIEPGVARPALATVLAAVPSDVATVVHCCAPDVPVELIRTAGADGVALDVSLLSRPGWDQVATAVEGGMRLWAGIVPTGERPAPPEDALRPLLTSWERLGLADGLLTQAVLTPACGLAGGTSAEAARTQRAALEAADLLAERIA